MIKKSILVYLITIFCTITLVGCNLNSLKGGLKKEIISKEVEVPTTKVYYTENNECEITADEKLLDLKEKYPDNLLALSKGVAGEYIIALAKYNKSDFQGLDKDLYIADIESSFDDSGIKFESIGSVEEKNINGLDCSQFDIFATVDGGEVIYRTIIVETNEAIYDLSISILKAEEESYRDIVQDILDSFKINEE